MDNRRLVLLFVGMYLLMIVVLCVNVVLALMTHYTLNAVSAVLSAVSCLLLSVAILITVRRSY